MNKPVFSDGRISRWFLYIHRLSAQEADVDVDAGGTMAFGFIAYARGDEGLADALQQKLNSHPLLQIDFWRDRQLHGGADWDREIRERIRQSDVILFLLTGRACLSEYIWRVEFAEARRRWQSDRLTLIIPLTAEAVLPLLRRRGIDRFQSIPIPEGTLSDCEARETWLNAVSDQIAESFRHQREGRHA